MNEKILSWYSGYKAKEYPLVFSFKGTLIKTKLLKETELIEDEKTGERKMKFTVLTESGGLFHILVGEEIQISKVS